MAAPDATAVLRNGGRLYINPTDLTDVPDGLGTELGIVIGAAADPDLSFGDVASEDDGVEGRHYLGNEGEFVAIIRSRDDDAYGAVFPNWTVGGSTGRPVVHGANSATVQAGAGNSTPPGTEVAPVSLLFVPYDATGVAFYARNALPEVEVAARMRFARRAEMVVPVAFSCAPDASGETWLLGTLADLALIP